MFERITNYPRKIFEYMITARHRRRLYAETKSYDKDYISYLDMQLERTLSKRQLGLQNRCRDFIDLISTISELSGRRVLCVGCRNKAELDYFMGKGVREIVGIDLYSTDPRIKVMDMHAMGFENGSLDLVFSSHSLEHAYDPKRVAAEILRVTVPGGIIAIEVPVSYQVGGSDRFDFRSIDNLHSMFLSAIDSVLWTQEIPISIGYDTAAIRTVFSTKR